jgi:hypothetical protein
MRQLPDGYYYTVNPNDNLSLIAQSFGISVTALKSANPWLAKRIPADWVNEGDQLFIPRLPPFSKTSGPTKTILPCQQCKISELTIKCGHHEERNFSLKVLAPDTQSPLPTNFLGAPFAFLGGARPTLQVIGREKREGLASVAFSTVRRLIEPEMVNLTFKGKCCNNSRACPKLLIQTPGKIQAGFSPLNLEASFPQAPVVNDIWDALGFAWDTFKADPPPASTYTIDSLSCSNKQTPLARIDVFPQYDVSGTISVGFTQKVNVLTGELGSNRKKKKYKTALSHQTTNTWLYSGSIDCEIDGSKRTFGISTETDLGKRVPFMKMRKVANTIAYFLGLLIWSIGAGRNGKKNNKQKKGKSGDASTTVVSEYGTLEIQWPNFVLSFGLKNAEAQKGALVENYGYVKVALEPFIGINGTVDLVNWIILFYAKGKLGTLLIQMKEELEAGIESEYASIKASLSIELSAGMNIGGFIQFKRESLTHQWSAESELNFNVPITLKAHVSAKGHAFMISFGAGVEAGGKTSVGLKAVPKVENGVLSVEGYRTFGGIIVFYSSYLKLGKKSTTKPPQEYQKKYEHSEQLVPPSSDNEKTKLFEVSTTALSNWI